jgi:hypothetical protein
MKREFVVIDHEGNVSYGMVDKNNALPETFETFAKAEKRAKELARDQPGETIKIYELTAETIVATQPAVTSRAHPREHYK